MGTHPIFESDFDCLTVMRFFYLSRRYVSFNIISDMTIVPLDSATETFYRRFKDWKSDKEMFFGKRNRILAQGRIAQMNYSQPDLEFSHIKSGVEYAVKEFQSQCLEDHKLIKDRKASKRLQKMFDSKDSNDEYLTSRQRSFYKSLSATDVKIMKRNISGDIFVPFINYKVRTYERTNKNQSNICQLVLTAFCVQEISNVTSNMDHSASMDPLINDSTSFIQLFFIEMYQTLAEVKQGDTKVSPGDGEWRVKRIGWPIGKPYTFGANED